MEFRILGPLEVSVADEPVELGGPRQRAVLAVLLLHANAAVPRGQLLDAVWGESAPRTAVGSLQVYVHGLRRRSEPSGSRRGEAPTGCRCNPGELDLDRFEELVERAHAAPRRRQAARGGGRPGRGARPLAWPRARRPRRPRRGRTRLHASSRNAGLRRPSCRTTPSWHSDAPTSCSQQSSDRSSRSRTGSASARS